MHTCIKCKRSLPRFQVGINLYRDSLTMRVAPGDEWKDNAPTNWWCGNCVTTVTLEQEEFDLAKRY